MDTAVLGAVTTTPATGAAIIVGTDALLVIATSPFYRYRDGLWTALRKRESIDSVRAIPQGLGWPSTRYRSILLTLSRSSSNETVQLFLP
jgi:hypothetical protein